MLGENESPRLLFKKNNFRFKASKVLIVGMICDTVSQAV